jgi:hypothetical protein
MLVLFGIHLTVLKKTDCDFDYTLLVWSYIVNFLLALLIVLVITKYINRLKTYIGFLFMFGSLLKFAVFFIWFYPIFKADNDISHIEFGIFFIPYIISLLFETKKLTTILNNM